MHPQSDQCRPSPSNVHGIVHVASSMSRPLRAAMRWPTASQDIDDATRSAPRTRGWQRVGTCEQRCVVWTAFSIADDEQCDRARQKSELVEFARAVATAPATWR
jgi:hypothetical protein